VILDRRGVGDKVIYEALKGGSLGEAKIKMCLCLSADSSAKDAAFDGLLDEDHHLVLLDRRYRPFYLGREAV